MANFTFALILVTALIAVSTRATADLLGKSYRDDLELPPPNQPGTLEKLNNNFQGNSRNTRVTLKGEEVHQIFGNELEIRSTADYLNKLTRNPGFARSVRGITSDSGLVSRMAVFYKRCPSNQIVTVPDGPPSAVRMTRRKEYCAVNLPYEPNPVDTSRQSSRKNNQYEVICICP